VSFVAITLCVASQRVFVVCLFVCFVIDSVRKLVDAPPRARVYGVITNDVSDFLIAHIICNRPGFLMS
jgi:hypothetical protein